MTVGEAIERYEQHLVDRGRKPVSVARGVAHLRTMFTDEDERLGGIVAKRAEALYEDLRTRNSRMGRPVSVDTRNNCVAECRTFARWAVKRGWLKADPFTDIELLGRRRRGKPQLRLDEARKLLDVAVPRAEAGDLGALVTALILLTGLRSGEAAGLRQRDVDDGGKLLWISEAKTAAGVRRLDVPAVLVEPLKAAAKEGDVFPGCDRWWVARQVMRLCKLASVPVVPPHGLRGTHSTLAQDHGATSHVVAAALGHSSSAVTERHYTAAGTAERARARRALKVLTGGKS